MAATRELTTSQHDWLRVRNYLSERRYQLAVEAADAYPDVTKVADTPLLARPSWLPAEPVRLDAVDLAWGPSVAVDKPAIGNLDAGLPQRPDGRRYSTYSDVIAELARPSVFENRQTYRLLDATLSTRHSRLAFGRGTYFDGIDTGEASAHEFAARQLGCASEMPLRTAIGDPTDLTKRPTNLAISTLTLRRGAVTGDLTFLLHWRDPKKVGHAGGLYQVVPVGVFQPSGDAAWNHSNDFSLWKAMVREFAEELRGESEDYHSEVRPIDYDSWPFYRRLTDGLRDGAVRAYCLGMGVDPLTFATDLLTAVVLDAPVFDELFGVVVDANAEGRVIGAQPFAGPTVDDLVRQKPMQAAGAALLRLAWNHRRLIQQ